MCTSSCKCRNNDTAETIKKLYDKYDESIFNIYGRTKFPVEIERDGIVLKPLRFQIDIEDTENVFDTFQECITQTPTNIRNPQSEIDLTAVENQDKQ